MKPIVRFEFLLREGDEERWVQLQGSGGQLGNSYRTSLEGAELARARNRLLTTALHELAHKGSVRVWHDHEADPAKRIEIAKPDQIATCREVRSR